MFEFIKKIITANHNAIKGEIDEIKGLKVTDEDTDQADKITDIVIAALGQYGVVLTPFKSLIKKAIAYGLRDLKDGAETPNKLIIKRIIDEYKKEFSKS